MSQKITTQIVPNHTIPVVKLAAPFPTGSAGTSSLEISIGLTKRKNKAQLKHCQLAFQYTRTCIL